MKKVLSCITVLLALLLCNTVTPIFANDSQIKDYDLCSVVEEKSLIFMEKSTGKDVDIKNTTIFWDLQGRPTAYCVSFENNNEDSGYTLVSPLNMDNPLIEFAFEGPGIVDTINRTINKEGTYDLSNSIIYLGPGLLFVADWKYSELIDPITQIGYDLDTIKNTISDVYESYGLSSFDVYSGIIDWNPSLIPSSSINMIPSVGSYSNYWLMTDFSNGEVCSPTAATNILWYWGEARGRSWVTQVAGMSGLTKATYIFNILFNEMGTSTTLGTADSMVKYGYEYWIELRGFNYSITIVPNNVFSSFSNALNSGCPVHVMLRSSYHFGTGHDVMGIGYATDFSGDHYLAVLDGWYEARRFVIFDYYPSVSGLKIWVGTSAF